MRKSVCFVVLLCAAMMLTTTGCGDKKPEKTVDTVKTDTVPTDTADSDTMAGIIAETPMPKAADQLFDDFFFNFIANPKVQKARIQFPLPVATVSSGQEKVVLMQAAQWKMDRFFRHQGYYTLIFDNEKQMDSAKSTNIDTVVVEKIHLKEGMVDQYFFDHQDGRWRLSKIRKMGFSYSQNASFLKFLQKFFAQDGRGMVLNPLPYHGADPNGEETNIVNTKIPAADWSNFLPEVPGDLVYNILYGQKYEGGSTKILTFKGLSNGLETGLIFKQSAGTWRLVKINAF